ncbi:MAG: DUF92 domain-containing protein [Armatimonadota bacterium]
MISLALAAVVAAAAWRLRWLTRDGALAAFIVGAAILEFGGVVWALALAAFFASGSLLTLVGRARKSQPEHRGRGRTWLQVVGTGGVAAGASVLYGTGIVPALPSPLLPAAFFGALAAAAADTWATEIGILSAAAPRLITTGETVRAGTSGGVTMLGTKSGIAGAAMIAAFGVIDAQGSARVFVTVLVAGVLSMLLDSLLGATVQASFRRPDGGMTEEPERGTALERGIAWMTNPMVNLIATLAGAIIAGGLTAW